VLPISAATLWSKSTAASTFFSSATAVRSVPAPAPAAPVAFPQGLTLAHFKAQLEDLRDTSTG
jgi:hypothetical protein